MSGSEDSNFELSIKTKRGTGTREQDVLKGRVRAESAEELSDRADEMMELIEEKANEARQVSPSDES